MVKFSGEDRGIWAVAIQGEELLLEDILLAINGTMVAITISSATTVEEVSTTAEGIPILMNREVKFVDPNSSRCVGYAVIRGIDVIKRWMFLLSPWEPSSVKEDENGKEMVVTYNDRDKKERTERTDRVFAADGPSSTIRHILLPHVERTYAGYVSLSFPSGVIAGCLAWNSS